MPLMTSREAMEAALLDDPDDLVRHAAYADMLIEDGDPRGDFIRIQLQLEDATLAANVRKELEAQSAVILKQHEREWLGPLYDSVYPEKVSPNPREFQMEWRRGWIDSVDLQIVDEIAISRLAQNPFAKLLRSISGFFWEEVGRRIGTISWPNLRSLRLEMDRTASAVIALIANRSLARLTQLALDEYYPHRDFDPHDDEPVWLADFCASPLSLTLQDLAIVDLNFDDGSIDTLLSTGMIGRLKRLDLRKNGITDDGALALAAHPDVRKLKYLNLESNLLSAVGIEALATVGHCISTHQRFGNLGTIQGDL